MALGNTYTRASEENKKAQIEERPCQHRGSKRMWLCHDVTPQFPRHAPRIYVYDKAPHRSIPRESYSYTAAALTRHLLAEYSWLLCVLLATHSATAQLTLWWCLLPEHNWVRLGDIIEARDETTRSLNVFFLPFFLCSIILRWGRYLSLNVPSMFILLHVLLVYSVVEGQLYSDGSEVYSETLQERRKLCIACS